MLCYYTSTIRGYEPKIVYYLDFSIDSEEQISEETPNEKHLLDVVESILRTYRPSIFSDTEQNS